MSPRILLHIGKGTALFLELSPLLEEGMTHHLGHHVSGGYLFGTTVTTIQKYGREDLITAKWQQIESRHHVKSDHTQIHYSKTFPVFQLEYISNFHVSSAIIVSQLDFGCSRLPTKGYLDMLTYI